MTLADNHTQATSRAEPATFDSLDPATGSVASTHPVHTEDDVRAAVARAREAATWWSALSYDERAERLGAWKAVIAQRIDDLAEVMRREMGKPHADGVLEEAPRVAVMPVDGRRERAQPRA